MSQSRCAICEAPGKLCISCKSAAYCSTQCQKTDWPLHKIFCKSFTSFTPRPTSSHKLAFYFAVDSKAPQLTWVHCSKTHLPDDGDVFDVPHTEDLLGIRDSIEVERIPIIRTEYNSTGDNYTLVIHCRGDSLGDESKINQSIMSITKGALSYYWSGPLLVMHQNGNYTDPYTTISDVNLGDLSATVRFIKEYGKARKEDNPLEVNQIPPNQSRTMGVRISCEADMALGSNKYEAVEVGDRHAIYGTQPTDLSRQFGLPLLVQKLPPNPTWQQGSEKGSIDNEQASILYLEMNVDSDSWCTPQRDWQQGVGSVLVARKDKKSINPQQLSAMIEYCKLASIGASQIPADVMARKEYAQKVFSQAAFEAFLQDVFKPRMVSRGLKSYADVKSPFSI
jgi:hypothetical protein